MMLSVQFVFSLMCLIVGLVAQMSGGPKRPSVRQGRRFVSVQTADTLTLQCFYDSNVAARFYWYKQTLGQKPRLVSTFYKYEKNATFDDEFRSNPRFTLDTEKGKNHLRITDVQISDSGTYYCASGFSTTFEFAEGTTVSVKGSDSNIKASVHQSASESIQPGGSVTLSCTVHTGTCDGGHSVYWFKNQEEEESQPGLIYTNGGRNDQCERKPDTQTHTCVYNLPMKSLNLSHAGTYYCAVVSCGQILFGDGTKLDFQDEDSLVPVYFLIGALAFATLLNIFLGVSLYVLNKKSSCTCTGFLSRKPVVSTRNTEGDQMEENIQYSTLKSYKVNRSRRDGNTNDPECVYSRVKH